MPIRITEYTEDLVDAVTQFNGRLQAAGCKARFSTSPTPEWLPKLPGRKLFQEFFLALDDDSAVRGAYILKHRQFAVKQDTTQIGCFQLPISEGVIHRRYVPVAAQLMLDAQREPLLIAVGMG